MEGEREKRLMAEVRGRVGIKLTGGCYEGE